MNYIGVLQINCEYTWFQVIITICDLYRLLNEPLPQQIR